MSTPIMLFVIESGSQKHKCAKVQIQSEELTNDLIIQLGEKK